jgi:hypothetical protein
MVMIRAGSVTGAGTINADGQTGLTPLNDGGGGGGAGGSVLVLAQTGGLAGLTVTAAGGAGTNAWPTQPPNGNPGERHGPGGGGGSGGGVCDRSITGCTGRVSWYDSCAGLGSIATSTGSVGPRTGRTRESHGTGYHPPEQGAVMNREMHVYYPPLGS